MTETAMTRKELDLSQIRERLSSGEASSNGQAYWRSLDELAQTEEFEEMLHREFPEQATEWSDGVSRRNFLKLMSASLAFGGLTNCTIQPEEKIVPWVRAPENLIPGKPLFYATAMPFGGIGAGILVESHMGRPTKIEGNPDHPASVGRTHSFTQAAILDLYDPDRATVVTNAGRISTWGSFVQDLSQGLDVLRLKKGKGLHVLTGTVTSPTLGQQLKSLEAQLPEASWHQYDPVNGDNARRGAQLAFGEPVNTYYDFGKAKVVLSLDADFSYGAGPAYVRYARDFAAGRRLRENGKASMNRLYMVESTPSATGSIADHRLALDTGGIEAFAVALATELGVSIGGQQGQPPFDDAAGWIRPLAADLRRNGGASVVVAGVQQSAAVHALVQAINDTLGNTGKTVHHTEPLEAESVDQSASIRDLAHSMKAGEVEILIVVGGNPAYDAPTDLNFAEAMSEVEFRAQLSSSKDETSELCHWHIPESHFLESWSDIRSYDGTVSIMQPLIKPLYNSKSAHDLVGALIGQSGRPALDLIQEFWQKQPALAGADFESNWQRALHEGLIPDTQFEAKEVHLKTISVPAEIAVPLEEGELELVVRPDPTIWDGRLSNNGWLQETPKPVTKLTWDNAALLSPRTAERLGVTNEQVIELKLGDNTVKAPVWVLPGQASGVVTIHLGYGRRQVGRVGTGTGFDAYRMRTSRRPDGSKGLLVVKTFDRHPLASTQDHSSMEGRDLVRQATFDEYQKHPDFAHKAVHEPPADLTLYSEFDYSKGNQWGMAIDLNACVGCNACSVACQSENNIPIVGKEEVLNGREMSWIRVDRYFSDLDDPEILNQPIPCQQCENAPCEVVCPVTATSHSEEGLNDMVYNRCVGTRYCSNNCPYKVRRFNWLQYADRETPSLKLQRNPDVTVRARGVMEKCTYCVQRINSARITSKKSGVPIADGQIQTACQQACPTEAIVFGNINDPSSAVSTSKKSSLNYGILTELNTRPRTTYLARVKNPNPAISRA
jgi:MoCo/4Fe-4S cofactor protein with predicted Tat translocation signal